MSQVCTSGNNLSFDEIFFANSSLKRHK